MRITLFIILLFSLEILVAQNQSAESVRFLNAAYEGDSATISVFLQDSTVLNSFDWYGNNALMFASAGGYFSICKMLVESGIVLNSLNEYGRSALMLAVIENNFEIAEYLAWKGSDVNLKGEYGKTALHLAVSLNDFLMTDMLIFYGADVNAKSTDGSSPIHYAAYYGADEMVKLLLSKNAIPNQPNNKGFTPLMLAAQNNKTNSFQLLNSEVNDILKRNKKGFSAIDILAQNNNVKLLKELPLLNYSPGGKKIADSLLYSAYLRNQYGIAKELISIGAKKGTKLLFASAYFAFPQKFAADDYFTGFEVGVNEHLFQTSIIAGFLSRPFSKRLLINHEGIRLQVRENRWYSYTGLRKDWRLKIIDRRMLAFTTAVKYAYSIYKHHGFSSSGHKSILQYETGFALKHPSYTLSVFYEYSDWKMNRTSPYQFGISFQIIINRYRPYNKFEYIWQ
jgi:ankyrin repeat protein